MIFKISENDAVLYVDNYATKEDALKEMRALAKLYYNKATTFFLTERLCTNEPTRSEYIG